MVAKYLQRLFPLFGLTTVLMLAPSAPAVGAPGDNELVSINIFTGEAAGQSHTVSVSRDGRYVAFESNASTLVAGDTNGVADIFVRDHATGVTERVSVGLGGVEANGDSRKPSISRDGRYVVFNSKATNLVASDVNGTRDVFRYDRTTGLTKRASVASFGIELHEPWDADVSDDGRFVVFGDWGNVLLRDLQESTTQLIKALPDDGSYRSDEPPVISGNGRFVLYRSYPGDALTIYDRWTGSREVLPLPGSAGPASISPDGRWVAYKGDGTYQTFRHVYLLDRATRQVRLVSCDAAGRPAKSYSYSPSVSDDGRYVAFPSAFDADFDIFIKDMRTGYLEHVAPAGVWENSPPSLSGDGRFVGFRSMSDLVPNDRNTDTDVYLHEASSSAPDALDYYLRPFKMDYGQVGVGTALKKGFTLSNVGSVPLPITTLEVLGLHRSQFAVTNYCGSTVAVGQRCWISVTFKPTSVGYRQANLHVVAGGIERHRALRGTGI
jgi:Tol biopolymer transport system component